MACRHGEEATDDSTLIMADRDTGHLCHGDTVRAVGDTGPLTPWLVQAEASAARLGFQPTRWGPIVPRGLATPV